LAGVRFIFNIVSIVFQKGHKFAKGGARPGAGRPSKGKMAASQIVRTIIEGNAEKLSKRYIDRALAQYGDRVLCHAIDKLLPQIDVNASQRPIAIQVVIEGSRERVIEPDAKANGSGDGGQIYLGDS